MGSNPSLSARSGTCSGRVADSDLRLFPRREQIRQRTETLRFLRSGEQVRRLAAFADLRGIAGAASGLHHRKRDAALLGIDGDDRHLDVVTDRHYLTRVGDAPVERKTGDMNEPL